MPNEATTHPGRGRGRKRLKEGPPILIDAWESRVVKTKRGKMRIENYAVVNARTLEEVIGRMSAPELRRALDLEQANPLRRRKLLLRMTHVLGTLEREQKLDEIRRTVPAQLPRQGRVHSVGEIEAAALRTFGPSTQGPSKGKPRRANGSSYRSTLTKKLHQRKAAFESAAAEQVRLHGPLTRRDRDKLRRMAGDHMCGNPCQICGASFQGDKL
jgi:hypothetical protein